MYGIEKGDKQPTCSVSYRELKYQSNKQTNQTPEWLNRVLREVIASKGWSVQR